MGREGRLVQADPHVPPDPGRGMLATARAMTCRARLPGAVVLEARVACGTGGGPEKTILNSPRFLWSAGYTTLCAYMHPPGDRGFDELRQKAAACHAPLLSVPDRGPWDWRVVTRL